MENTSSKISPKKLIEAAVHFGHKTTYWSPKMQPFIFGEKNGIHLINVSLTALYLERAREFLRSVAAQNKQILWVGTKKAARDVVKRIGIELNQPYVIHRWIGGTLTNPHVKKAITRLLHSEDVLSKADTSLYTKKELSKLLKTVNKLRIIIGGITHLRLPVGAIVLIDIKKEQAALQEAKKMDVPIVALVDTNSDPSLVDWIIPGNDDTPKAIAIVADYLAQGVKEGMAQAKTAAPAQEEHAMGPEETVDVTLIDTEEDTEKAQNKAKVRKFRETAKKDTGKRPAVKRT